MAISILARLSLSGFLASRVGTLTPAAVNSVMRSGDSLINFAATLCYLVMSGFLLWYTPNSFDTMHAHFTPILAPMLRIIIASVVVYLKIGRAHV